MAAATVRDTARRVELFHALSDETRLEIVALLRNGERCVCDLMSDLDAAQSRLSFHLKVLKDAGVVKDRRDGRWVHYELNGETLAELREHLSDLEPSPVKRSRKLAVACC